MLSKPLQDLLNSQLNFEFYSEYTYLSMAAYFNSQDLDGFANFFHVQTQEERFHAMKIFNYIIDTGGEVILDKFDKPQTGFNSPTEVFEIALEHEKEVTRRVNDLMDLAIQENDHSAKGFIQWLVDEQVEEMAMFEKNLKKTKLVEGNGHGILMLDNEFAQRTFTPPVA